MILEGSSEPFPERCRLALLGPVLEKPSFLRAIGRLVVDD
jgi:hypothetical protein